MRPSQQRFRPHDLARTQCDNRLVHKPQLFALQGALQVRLQLHAFDRLRAHRRRKGDRLRLPRGLRPVERDIGFANQFLGRARIILGTVG